MKTIRYTFGGIGMIIPAANFRRLTNTLTGVNGTPTGKASLTYMYNGSLKTDLIDDSFDVINATVLANSPSVTFKGKEGIVGSPSTTPKACTFPVSQLQQIMDAGPVVFLGSTVADRYTMTDKTVAQLEAAINALP